MTSIAYQPEPRYAVETANTIQNVVGKRYPGVWNFALAFNHLSDATAAADRLAEDNEYVRVIDRHNSTEED